MFLMFFMLGRREDDSSTDTFDDVLKEQDDERVHERDNERNKRRIAKLPLALRPDSVASLQRLVTEFREAVTSVINTPEDAHQLAELHDVIRHAFDACFVRVRPSAEPVARSLSSGDAWVQFYDEIVLRLNDVKRRCAVYSETQQTILPEQRNGTVAVITQSCHDVVQWAQKMSADMGDQFSKQMPEFDERGQPRRHVW